MDNFNQLSPDETERLATLAEECGEIVHIIGKVLRHGFDSSHPDYHNVSNRKLLASELGDLAALIGLVVSKDINMNVYTDSFHSKYSRMKPHLHHN